MKVVVQIKHSSYLVIRYYQKIWPAILPAVLKEQRIQTERPGVLGWDLSGTPEETLNKNNGRIQMKWLLEAYKYFL